MTSIEHVLAVVEHLSFRRAGEALGISQSSISKRVAALEDQIGVALFERHHSGVRVTDAGEKFFRLAVAALEYLDQATKVAGKIGRVEAGHLRIGILSSLASGFLPSLVRKFTDQHPDVETVIEDCMISDCVTLLRKKHFDVVFSIGDLAADDCESERLWNEQIFIALPESHPLGERETVDWADLRCETMILNQSASWRTKYDGVLRKLATLTQEIDVRRLSVARDTLMHMVALGQGISLTSEAAVA
ncbi:LysR family transcriptional regulator [Methylovirgula sp. HY1]|uniref:LysR family transcriptional regulator n=1 Tax=Methylovirgula sp. HY1 TaxID=2822761 RepID=UPI001C5BBC4C|nr:LysR family transcriptional regulator [Methylovirgula sp. HY1]